jgi:hypothetical protein
MNEIISVTIDGETYRRLKETYEGVQNKQHPINFDYSCFYCYGWTFYTKDNALIKMAEKYQFMLYKTREQFEAENYKLKQSIEKLKSEKIELSYNVLAWLGEFRDNLPDKAITRLQDLCKI